MISSWYTSVEVRVRYLSWGDVSQLFLDWVEVLLPGGEERVKLLPVAQAEGPVHGRGHEHHPVSLDSWVHDGGSLLETCSTTWFWSLTLAFGSWTYQNLVSGLRSLYKKSWIRLNSEPKPCTIH
jgi:hypothetical protein